MEREYRVALKNDNGEEILSETFKYDYPKEFYNTPEFALIIFQESQRMLNGLDVSFTEVQGS